MRTSPRVRKAAGVGLENRDKKIAKILQIPTESVHDRGPEPVGEASNSPKWGRRLRERREAGGECSPRRTFFCLRNSASIGGVTACLGATSAAFSSRCPSASERSMFWSY